MKSKMLTNVPIMILIQRSIQVFKLRKNQMALCSVIIEPGE